MKILKLLDEKLEEWFLVTLLGAVTTLVFVQVIMRYVFQSSLFWSEEAARYMFIWLIWIGAAYATKKKSHIAITIFTAKLKGIPKTVVNAIIMIAWIGFAVFLTVTGFQLTELIISRGQLTPAMRIPMGLVYASVPVGCGLMTFRLIQHVVKDSIAAIKERKEKTNHGN